MDNHLCGIDCKLEVSADGRRSHIMLPADPNSAAGRYQAAQNISLTRREYRATGQDESRAVRIWNATRPRHNIRLNTRLFGALAPLVQS